MLRILTLGARLVRAALALVYPARCAACDALLADENAAFCDACTLSLVPIARSCPQCARPLPVAPTQPPPCIGCLQRRPLYDGALATFEFGGAIAQAIRRLKWSQLPELAAPLGRLLEETWARAPPDYRAIDLIVPVPLHPKRLRERELNQSAALARAMKAAAKARAEDQLALVDPVVREVDAARARIRLDTRALTRVRNTPPQTGLGIDQRRRNVIGAFVVRDSRRVRDRRVLLVDDVLTTGATADACASALYKAGAASVLVLTLGRAVT
ncbi:MAG TPA: ComF family protein [Polyangia bacterium]|jgi:predicted amidophosphoribosyltransferase|nr:ComF family protein [Polyangia bacterium]